MKTVYQLLYLRADGKAVDIIEKTFLRDTHRADALRWARSNREHWQAAKVQLFRIDEGNTEYFIREYTTC